MKRRIRYLSTLSALCVLFMVAACTDRDLETVAKALRDTAQGVSVFQTSVIDANAKGFLSDDITRELLTIGISVNTAGHQAVEITRGINSLEPQHRTSLLLILEPLIRTLSNADSTLLMAITDEQARNTVRVALAVIQTTLSTAQLALAAR